MMLGAHVPLEIIATSSSRVILQRYAAAGDRFRTTPHLIFVLAEVRERRIVRWLEFHDPDLFAGELGRDEENADWPALESEPAYRPAVRCLGAAWTAKRA